jgi:Protein of unknown function (DUF3349)
VGNTAILVLVVITALGFDFTNGFHDTANAGELERDADPESAEAIRKAIVDVTHHQPSDADINRVRARLAGGGWPLAKPSLEHWPNP